MGILTPLLAGPNPGARAFSPSAASLGGVALTHVAIAFLLAASVPAERLAAIVRPLAVRVIETASVPTSAPLPKPPMPLAPAPQARPRPAAVAPPPLLAANPTAPAVAEFTIAPQPAATVPPAPTSPVQATAVTPPRFDAEYLNNPKPPYPAAARRLGEEGKVVLRVHVTPAGRAAEVEVKTPSGFARLDAAACAAVAQWRFAPARQGDEPVAAWVLVPIVFSLQG